MNPEDRRTGLGSSEIAAAIGVSEFKDRTPFQVYAIKRGLIEDPEPSERMIWGKELEQAVARVYARQHQRKIQWLDQTVRHPSLDWLFATPDFDHLDGALELGESKTALFEDNEKWGEEGSDAVPVDYICQTQTQMEVLGRGVVVIPVLFGRFKLRTYRVERDQELIDTLKDQGEYFWRNHVMAGVPPRIDASAAAKAWLKKRFPEAVEPIRDATEEETDLALSYKKVKELESLAAEKKGLLGNRLKELIGDARGIEGEWGKLLYSDVAGSTYTVTRAPGRSLKPYFRKS